MRKSAQRRNGGSQRLVHANGASNGSLSAQIEFFKTHCKVIVMDSRDQGRSGDSAGPLTREKMTNRRASLLDYLKTGPVDVLGWSDGGIEALLLGVRPLDKVKKRSPWPPTSGWSPFTRRSTNSWRRC